ncbi:MAG: B12-binding domain-containing radical SAM protein [Oscillospiraceae bacterium]|nr:B12-binding domain-containing radical SAM protein [Oscillospiraceae bacterium]
MKIAFIRVNMFEHIGTDAMKPILFGIIRHLTPQRHEIVFLDERAEALPESLDADIIAFSVETYTAKRAYILAKRYRTARNIIVMGGFHASVCADEMLDYADSVLIGDAEDTWLDFLADCEQGRPQPKYTSHETAPLGQIPDTPGVYRHRYHGIGVCQISRGCKFHCDFCSIKTMYKCVRRKSPEDVAAELRRMKEKYIFFTDDNLFYNKQDALRLFETIAPLKKRWACQISMDAARDEEILDAMQKAGCFLVLMGFESLNASSLAEMHKAANAAQDYDTLIRRIYAHKLLIYGTFVLGCDADTPDVFDRTLDFAVRNHIAVTNFNPLIPMPGTGVYARMEREGRLRYKKWWLSDTYRYGETAFLPKRMTPEALQDGCLRIRTEFYSLPCILRRFFGNIGNMSPMTALVFLLANFVSGREIRAKQGQLLGGVLGASDTDQTEYRQA